MLKPCWRLSILALVSICLPAAINAGKEPEVVLEEFVYEEAPFPSCHASSLVEVAPGHIIATWFGGTDEGEEDVGIWIAHRENDAWTPPENLAQHEGVPCWNPVLWKDNQSGQVLLFYKAGPSPMTWTGLVRRSDDDGRTWAEAEMLPAGILGPIRAKPFQLEDGTLICGSSVESWRAWGARCEITKDLGKSWDITNPINLEDNLYGVIQPTLFRTGPESLRMLLRTRSGKIGQADSSDNGMSWTQAHLIDLPNPSAGIDAVNMQDGRVALIYNPTSRGRGKLNIGVSEDNGETWPVQVELENTDGMEFSYPAMIVLQDGRLATTYTWDRKKIKFAILDPSGK
jgi:predicted neuraminidase